MTDLTPAAAPDPGSRPALPSATRRRLLSAGIAVLPSLLTGCGGGDGGTGVAGVGSGGTGSFSVGPIRGFGSIIVNGVRFDETDATVLDDAGRSATTADLRLGMVVEVSGSSIVIDPNGVRRASASTIACRSEIIGAVAAVDLPGGVLRVLGQTVHLTAATVFGDGLAGGLAALAVGDRIEVHGLSSAPGLCVATRIDRLSDLSSPQKLRGQVRALDTAARTFRIGDATIDYGGIGDQVEGLANDQYVRLDLVPVAGDRWLAIGYAGGPIGIALPDTVDDAEIEGFVTASLSPTLFLVDGIRVDASGVAALSPSIASGSRVEVKGSLAGGLLIARSVDLEDDDGAVAGGDTFEIDGVIGSVDRRARTFMLRGVTVTYDGAYFEDGVESMLAPGVKVDVKGRLAADGVTLVAREVEFDD